MKKRGKLVTLSAATILAVLVSGCTGNPSNNNSSESKKTSVSTSEKTEEYVLKEPEIVEYSDSIGAPVFSCSSGFYGQEFDLEINAVEGGGEIRYTLDGSIPDKNSPLYEEKIHISERHEKSSYLPYLENIGPESMKYVPEKEFDRATVVRAAVFNKEGISGPVVTNTYFTGLNQNEDYNGLAVVSLVTDPYNLFDYEKGIYVSGKSFDEWIKTEEAKAAEDWEYEGNYSQRGREWERPVYMQIFEPDSGISMEQNLGIRIMGKASRTYNQKSFRIYAREEYGEKNVNYPLIPGTVKENGSGEKMDKFRTFLLRNGGNDCDYVKLRDPFIQRIVKGKAVTTQESRPAVVFINGEYWGVYVIEEDYSDNFIQNNFDIDNKDVIMIKTGELEEGTDDDFKLYEELNDLITSDLSDKGNYDKLCEAVDIQSFADYFSIVIYTANEDCMAVNDNNWRVWRSRTVTDVPYQDGKWRFMLYDTEFSLGLYKEGETSRLNSFEEACDSKWFGSLMKSESFRDLFAASLRDTAERFKPDCSFTILDELAAQFKPVMPDSYSRFGPNWLLQYAPREQALLKYYDDGIAQIKKFLKERYEYNEDMINEVMNKY